MVGAGDASPTGRYLDSIGVRPTPRATCPFDPGYDPATRRGPSAAERPSDGDAEDLDGLLDGRRGRRHAPQDRGRHAAPAFPTVAGGGPFETAVAQRALPAYLDLCADVGLTRIECGEGFTELSLAPADIVRQAGERGLEVEFELGEKHSGRFTDERDRRADRHRAALAARRARCVSSSRRARARRTSGCSRLPGEFDAGPGRSDRRGLRPRSGAVRGAEQGEPVRADRSLRPRGAARQRAPGGGAAGRDLPPRPALRRLRQRASCDRGLRSATGLSCRATRCRPSPSTAFTSTSRPLAAGHGDRRHRRDPRDDDRGHGGGDRQARLSRRARSRPR